MANNIKKGIGSKATGVGQLIAGAKKRFPNGTQSITLDGASMTIGDATNELQSFLDHRTAVVAAQATAKAKVSSERAALPALLAFISAFTAFVRLTLGTQADALADFGLAPHKARTPMTAEQKAVAAAKREATRKARGTQGPKAKQAIHGNVTAQLVVTSAAEPAPAAGTAGPSATVPAASAPSGATTTAPK